jgi:serine protease Do
VTVTTAELPTEAGKLASIDEPPAPENEDALSNFGVRVQNVTPDLKQELGLKSDSGVVVMDVLPNSPAAVADIQKGDVITEVGRNQVTNTDSFQKALADQKGKPNLLLLLDRKGVKTYSIVKVGK